MCSPLLLPLRLRTQQLSTCTCSLSLIGASPSFGLHSHHFLALNDYTILYHLSFAKYNIQRMSPILASGPGHLKPLLNLQFQDNEEQPRAKLNTHCSKVDNSKMLPSRAISESKRQTLESFRVTCHHCKNSFATPSSMYRHQRNKTCIQAQLAMNSSSEILGHDSQEHNTNPDAPSRTKRRRVETRKEARVRVWVIETPEPEAYATQHPESPAESALRNRKQKSWRTSPEKKGRVGSRGPLNTRLRVRRGVCPLEQVEKSTQEIGMMNERRRRSLGPPSPAWCEVRIRGLSPWLREHR